MNILMKEIVIQGHVVRNQVERRLILSRLEEELVMYLVVSDAEREERLEDTAKKRAAWRKRFPRMELERLSKRMKLLSIVDYDEFMEVVMVARDGSLDLDGDVTMMDESVRKPTFAVKSRRRFRGRLLKVTGRVKEWGVVTEMTEPSDTTTVVTQAGQV